MLSLIALIINTMYEKWVFVVIMGLVLTISYNQYIKYRVLEQ